MFTSPVHDGDVSSVSSPSYLFFFSDNSCNTNTQHFYYGLLSDNLIGNPYIQISSFPACLAIMKADERN